MKKFILIALILTSFYALAQEQSPILLDNASSFIEETTENETSLINVDKSMKKAGQIEKAKEEINKNQQKRKIILDNSQINHQRALDYATRHNNSNIFPTF